MTIPTYLVTSFAKADTCGVSTPGTLVAADEAHVGRGHLQHRVSPHMLVLRAACTPELCWIQYLEWFAVPEEDVYCRASTCSEQHTLPV